MRKVITSFFRTGQYFPNTLYYNYSNLEGKLEGTEGRKIICLIYVPSQGLGSIRDYCSSNTCRSNMPMKVFSEKKDIMFLYLSITVFFLSLSHRFFFSLLFLRNIKLYGRHFRPSQPHPQII